MNSCSIPIDFMGEDFILAAHFKCTTLGTRNWRWSGNNPDEWPPEFDVKCIVLERDTNSGLGPSFEATGKLFWLLSQDDRLFYAMCEEMSDDY